MYSRDRGLNESKPQLEFLLIDKSPLCVSTSIKETGIKEVDDNTYFLFFSYSRTIPIIFTKDVQREVYIPYHKRNTTKKEDVKIPVKDIGFNGTGLYIRKDIPCSKMISISISLDYSGSINSGDIKYLGIGVLLNDINDPDILNYIAVKAGIDNLVSYDKLIDISRRDLNNIKIQIDQILK